MMNSLSKNEESNIKIVYLFLTAGQKLVFFIIAFKYYKLVIFISTSIQQ